MNVIGLDVGKNYAVSCCLNEFPPVAQQHFKQHRKEFEKLPNNRIGIAKLLALKPNAIVLEPTGHWYSYFWYKVAVTNNIEVLWVGHGDLKAQRINCGFKNKRDDEDALCLAITCFNPQFVDSHGQKRYLSFYDNELVTELRETFLQKEQLVKLRTNLIAQIKQRLSIEFPEIATKTFTISDKAGFSPAIGWLAGIHESSRYDNLYRKSVAPTLGIEISEYTKNHSKMLVDIELRITEHYQHLESLLNRSQFLKYNQVFDRFGFGINNRALLLYHIYPFEKFLVNGKPFIEWEESKGKMQKRNRSLRKFQAYLGMTRYIEQSGNNTKTRFGGSSMVRSHLYVWAVCQVAPTKNGYKVDTKVGRALTDRYIQMRQEQKIKGKDALIRILFKATRMLFYELTSTIS